MMINPLNGRLDTPRSCPLDFFELAPKPLVASFPPLRRDLQTTCQPLDFAPCGRVARSGGVFDASSSTLHAGFAGTAADSKVSYWNKKVTQKSRHDGGQENDGAGLPWDWSAESDLSQCVIIIYRNRRYPLTTGGQSLV